jgi:hypothetical protein
MNASLAPADVAEPSTAAIAIPVQNACFTLARLAEQTGATSTAVQLHDDLGRVLAGLYWPSDRDRGGAVERLGPALQALTLLSGLHDHWWASRPGTATAVPESKVLAASFYEFIHRPFGERHLATCAYPVRDDGSQIVVTMARGGAMSFGPRDLRAMERMCADHAADLRSPLVMAAPRLHSPPATAHRVELDPPLRPRDVSICLQALLTFFYGPMRRDTAGRMLLPLALEEDIQRYRDDYLCSAPAEDGGFYRAFTRNSRGRVLCLAVYSEQGRVALSAHEDVSQHARLRRIKAACRNLERDRNAVFTACLLVAEGMHVPAEIARRAGFGSLKSASALRLVNHARRIVSSI